MKRCARCDLVLPKSEFSPRRARCRPCDAEASCERRAAVSGRKVIEQRKAPLGPEFAIFMSACAVGGGDANVPPIVRPEPIETINHTLTQ